MFRISSNEHLRRRVKRRLQINLERSIFQVAPTQARRVQHTLSMLNGVVANHQAFLQLVVAMKLLIILSWRVFHRSTPPLILLHLLHKHLELINRPNFLHDTRTRSNPTNAKPVSPASLHSRSSFNDQSDLDHHDATTTNEQKEKRSRWRISRHRDDPQSLGHSLTPKKGLGSDAGAGASSSSIGSSARPRKSFTGDTMPAGS